MGPAVTVYATEFEKSTMLVLSQHSGGVAIRGLRLPPTIQEHLEPLLALYLGPQVGMQIAERVRETGLVWHLRSARSPRGGISETGGTSGLDADAAGDEDARAY
jgi:hypothetical protein